MARTRGFTTAELIIAMAILAILAGIAYAGFRPDRLAAAARMIHGDLQYARSLAINQKNRVGVIFASDDDAGEAAGSEYKIHNDHNENGIIDFGEDVTVRSLLKDYAGVTFSANRTAALFYPQGTSNSGTITLTNGSGSKYVIFSWTGRIRISHEPPS